MKYNNIDLLTRKFPSLTAISKYAGYENNISVKCEVCGYIWKAKFRHIINGAGCKKCRNRIPLTYGQFVDLVSKKAPFIDIVDSSKFKGSRSHSIFARCKICGYEWYTSKVYFNRNHDKCPVCVGRYRVDGVNTIFDTHPEVARLMVDKDMAHTLSYTSHKKALFQCSRCGEISTREINVVVNHGLSCKKCGDGISYPNKFMYSLLKQSIFTFEAEKTFEWSNRKIYDFYIRDINAIIEMHGNQHYAETNLFTDLSTQVDIDNLKQKYALDNGISHYVVIDSRFSNKDWIYNSISNSELKSIMNLDDIDFNVCNSDASNSRVYECCNLWNAGMTRLQIVDITMLSHDTVHYYLNRGNDMRILTRSITDDMQIPVICLTTGKKYKSLNAAYKDTGVCPQNIKRSCEDIGYDVPKSQYLKWEYIKDIDVINGLNNGA